MEDGVDEGVDIAALTPYRSIVDDNWRWADFRHRPGDIFICTPPKCGTTWMQTIVTTLIFDGAPLESTVMETSPWLEMRLYPVEVLLDRLEAQQHRRCIKTHTPADGIPWFDDARYVVVGRSGPDTFMSFLNHMRNMRMDLLMEQAESALAEGIELGSPPPIDDLHDFFAWWVDDALLLRFIDSYWQRRDQDNVLFVHFNDLKADLEGQMRRVARFLHIEPDEAHWPELVQLCTFSSMKARADEIGPFHIVFEGGAESFLYKGTNDRWRDVLSDDELASYEQSAKAILPADARSWLAWT